MEAADDEIVRQVLGGRRNRYRVLISRYERQIFNLMFRYSRNDEDAVDLTQEAFVKAYSRLEQYRYGDRFFSWFYSLAVNLARDWYRRKRRHHEMHANLFQEAEAPEHISTQEEQLEQSQEMALLEDALGQLSHINREIVILRYRQERSIKEIMEIFDMGESAVKMRLSRAVKQLRQIIHGLTENEK